MCLPCKCPSGAVLIAQVVWSAGYRCVALQQYALQVTPPSFIYKGDHRHSFYYSPKDERRLRVQPRNSTSLLTTQP
jgi:hypothetical protein